VKPDAKHPTAVLDIEKITEKIKYPDQIKSTRVRCARAIKGYPFPPGMTTKLRKEVEDLLKAGYASFDGELKGKYFSLKDDLDECRKLEDAHMMFLCDGDHGMKASNLMLDWPNNRGIFVNDKKTFCSWVGEEDMIRVISMRKGSDVKAVFALWMKGLNDMEAFLKKNGKAWLVDEKYGYLACCPTNIGTGMRASVHVELKGWHMEGALKLKHRALKLGLQARGARGESVEDDTDPTFDISNHKRMGYTEVELCNTMIKGLNILMDEDKELLEKHNRKLSID